MIYVRFENDFLLKKMISNEHKMITAEMISSRCCCKNSRLDLLLRKKKTFPKEIIISGNGWKSFFFHGNASQTSRAPVIIPWKFEEVGKKSIFDFKNDDFGIDRSSVSELETHFSRQKVCFLSLCGWCWKLWEWITSPQRLIQDMSWKFEAVWKNRFFPFFRFFFE